MRCVDTGANLQLVLSMLRTCLLYMSMHTMRAREPSLKDFRKDMIVEVHNEAGQKALAYKVYRCWISECQALPSLDADANAVAIKRIKVENEGWERDTSVTERQ